MDISSFDVLQTRIIILENLVLKLLAEQPSRARIVSAFEAFSAQQIAMHAANGTAADQIDGLRSALSELSSAATRL